MGFWEGSSDGRCASLKPPWKFRLMRQASLFMCAMNCEHTFTPRSPKSFITLFIFTPLLRIVLCHFLTYYLHFHFFIFFGIIIAALLPTSVLMLIFFLSSCPDGQKREREMKKEWQTAEHPVLAGWPVSKLFANSESQQHLTMQIWSKGSLRMRTHTRAHTRYI